MTPDGKTSKTPKLIWQEFHKIARKAMEEETGCTLDCGEIKINGKPKRFNLLNVDERIVGGIKQYYKTVSDNSPEGKLSTLGEYAKLMQRLEQDTKQKWRKLLVIVDPAVIKTYITRNDAWLDDIEIYLCDEKGRLTKYR